MTALPIIGCGLLGLGIVVLLVPLILKFCGTPHRAQDFHHTNERAVPRMGGLALAIAWIGLEVFIGLAFPAERQRVPGRYVVILSALAMFGLGFWDDLKPLGARRKLLCQILIALAVAYAGVGIESFKIPFTGRIVALNGWGALLTVLWLVGITNLINLIDGVDGLAGGICLMLMALLIYVGYQNGAFVLLTAGMTGALFGFLWFNFPPARIYLGDGGAYFLGFQIGLFAIVSSHKGSVCAALIAPLFVLALPIVDTSLAIIRRGMRGLPLFRPDRRHIHHHLLSMGMSRRKVVLSFYGVTMVLLVMAFGAFSAHGYLLPILLGLAVLLLLLCAGRLSFRREWFAVGRTLGNSLAMRHEIQYALSLMNWLNHEGARCDSLSDLFGDLVFAARRLGFTSIKITLADGEQRWEQLTHCDALRTFQSETQNGNCGRIEFQGPACLGVDVCPVKQLRTFDGHGSPCPNLTNPQLFELLAELLAEGWSQAASKAQAERRPSRLASVLGAAYKTSHKGKPAFTRRLTATPNKTRAVSQGPVAPWFPDSYKID